MNKEVKGTKPPRMREGQSYAGGKTLRKRMANLKRRQDGFPAKQGYTLAGSMKK